LIYCLRTWCCAFLFLSPLGRPRVWLESLCSALRYIMPGAREVHFPLSPRVHRACAGAWLGLRCYARCLSPGYIARVPVCDVITRCLFPGSSRVCRSAMVCPVPFPRGHRACAGLRWYCPVPFPWVPRACAGLRWYCPVPFSPGRPRVWLWLCSALRSDCPVCGRCAFLFPLCRPRHDPESWVRLAALLPCA